MLSHLADEVAGRTALWDIAHLDVRRQAGRPVALAITRAERAGNPDRHPASPMGDQSIGGATDAILFRSAPLTRLWSGKDRKRRRRATPALPPALEIDRGRVEVN